MCRELKKSFLSIYNARHVELWNLLPTLLVSQSKIYAYKLVIVAIHVNNMKSVLLFSKKTW